MYRYELHCHTAETSACASASGEDAVRVYAELGYTGMVITNHLNPELIERYREQGWGAAVAFLFAGYRAAAAQAERYGVLVLPGVEIRFPSNWNDYLVYGAVEQDFLDHPEIAEMRGVREMKALCEQEGWVLYQAHPFRNSMSIVKPEFLDGIEVFNGHRNHNSRNSIAAAWAALHQLPGICGSDFHDLGGQGTTATWFPEKITTPQELVAAIRGQKYRMQTDPAQA